LNSFWQAFAIVFVSEMGDKTQVVSFAFGTQYGLLTVLLGVFIGVAAMMSLTVAVGDGVSRLIPAFWMNIASGVLFIIFGLWALRKHKPEEEKPVTAKFGALLAIVSTFIIAELGDKTVFASMTVAGQQHSYLLVWLGSTLGMYLADVIAIVCGRVMRKQLPEKALRYGSAAIFILAGLYTLANALINRVG